MTCFLGLDEAGYGPNLGPLVISGTAWRVERLPRTLDLYRPLARVVAPAHAADDERIAIADSKQLYKPGGGLRLLERGLLPALGLLGHAPRAWDQVWGLLGADPGGQLERFPWHVDYRLPLPLELSLEEIDALTVRLGQGLAAAGVRLAAIRARAVFPDEFNALVARLGTKGAALSSLTLELLGDLLQIAAGEPVVAVCDKHGGRNRYGHLLQQRFPTRLVEVHGEGRQNSLYRWGPEEARVEVRFQPRAERYLPVALASMVCKYLRELAMRAFNHWWCSRVDNLRPTAGYATDAKRFKREIAAVQTRLGIDDALVWRCC